MSDESKLVDMNGRPVIEEGACCGGCGDDCEEKCAVDQDAERKRLLEQQFIKHPFQDEFIPMAVIESSMKTYIGGVAELYERSCLVVNPFLFREMISPEGALQVAMQVPVIALGCVDDMNLNHDGIYLLRNNRPQDMRLAATYEENYSKTRLGESGLVTPTQEDLIQISRG